MGAGWSRSHACGVYGYIAFGTLAAAYVVRPLGGFIFGLLGDRIGRKRVLMVTVVLMTLGTTTSGLLPGYGVIGIWAPILFIVVRVFQGLFTGGEYVGAMTYLGEQVPDRKRGLMVGFLPMGNLSGFVLAGLLVTGLQTWLPTHDMLTWGWRIPLLLSAPLGVVAFYLRLRLNESAAYENTGGGTDARDEPGAHQFRRTVAQQWKAMLICAALVLTCTAADYMLTGYLPTYLKVVVGAGHTAALVMITATLTILLLVLALVAWLSDRIGVKPIMWTGCGLLIVASIPAFLLIRSGGGYPVVFIGVLLIGLMELCFDSTSPATLPALFPTDMRYGALAIAYNISISVAGGSTPLVAQALVSGTGNAMMPAYMLIFAGLVGAVTLPFTPEVAGRRLPGSAPAVETEQEARELVADNQQHQGC
ncbi:MFS transporter [Candidatus Mycobacterium methanotrophicum]|uniref:MFS transporter n=1 Tax=Candidatus Mycobacterium methanotrophicum TaxID=2943498 RepID=A0ABY4QTN8_9MYCO|nr:MFS transporter [Candidatus Mycobacterium methanotrophicum]UQX13090.1 MFS transporter [Candidatus Mycobacterium methanotrophicum]